VPLVKAGKEYGARLFARLGGQGTELFGPYGLSSPTASSAFNRISNLVGIGDFDRCSLLTGRM